MGTQPISTCSADDNDNGHSQIKFDPFVVLSEILAVSSIASNNPKDYVTFCISDLCDSFKCYTNVQLINSLSHWSSYSYFLDYLLVMTFCDDELKNWSRKVII